MEENLLTILARRWGDRGSDPSPEPSEIPGSISARPFSVGLVVFSDRKDSQALAQATSLSRLITRSGRVVNLVTPESSPMGIMGPFRGLARQAHNLSKAIQASELVHLLADSYPRLWLNAFLASVLSRFYGKPVVLEVVGGWAAHINRWQLLSIKTWAGICQTILVSAGQSDLWSRMLGVEVEESKPVIDLESVPGKVLSEVQPSILADCVGLPMELTGEIIAGFEMTKQKYPRTELTILVDESSAFNRHRVVENNSSPGLKVRTISEKVRFEELLKPSDLFISCRTEPFAERKLLLAAAAGNVIFTGESSGLTKYLRSDCNFEPVTFSGRSDLADQLIDLVENRDRVGLLSRQSRGLAEQFAWDNLSPVWLSRYSKAVSG